MSAIANAVEKEDVQKPTLSEIAKIFRPTKRDLIILAKGVLADEREKLDQELQAKTADLKQKRDALNEEIASTTLKKMDKYKGLEAKLQKILPGIRVICSYNGSTHIDVSVHYHESVKAGVPNDLQKQTQEIETEIRRVDAIRCRNQCGRRIEYITDSEVLNVIVTQRMHETGELKALLEELTEAMRKDVHRTALGHTKPLQITEE